MAIHIGNPSESRSGATADPSATAVVRGSAPNVTGALAAPLKAARPSIPQVEILPEAAESADELFKRLRRLCAEGRVAIELDNKRLTHIDSPVSFEAWGNQLVYPLLLLTCAVWWWLGWKAGTGMAVASVLLYLTLGKAFLHRRIERRVREQVLEDVVRWRKLWNFGGVSLRRVGEGGDTDASCASPGDNWMEFVRRLTKTV
jgi:hypothetical protein